MQETLEGQGISVTRSHVTADAVYATYRSHATSPATIVNELETVMITILAEEGAKSVEAAILHAKRPLIALWHVDRSWIGGEQDQRVNEHRFLLRTLQTLRVVSFR